MNEQFFVERLHSLMLGIFLAFQTLNFAKQEELEQDEVAYFLKNEYVPLPLALHVKKVKNSN